MRSVKPKGWRNEPGRHSLAARGVRTKALTSAQIQQFGIRGDPFGDYDSDGVLNRFDCDPFDPRKQGAVHDFFSSILKKIRPRQEDPVKKAIDSAQNDLKGVNTRFDLKKWVNKHALLLEFTGLLGVAAVALELTGSPQLAIQEGRMIVRNPSVVQNALWNSSIVFSGLAIGTGLSEEYVTRKLRELEVRVGRGGK